jgi:hypothetical protein
VCNVLIVLFTYSKSAFAYDASWYEVRRAWSGEYPHGFTMEADETIDIRPELSLEATKSVSCSLRKGATYH